jgi:hypothetical protein
MLMFRGEREQNRFLLAFIIAWVISFVLGLVALAISTVLVVNFFYVIGGGSWAPPNESASAFFRGLALYAPGAALFTTVATLASLFLARYLASRYPRNHYAAYALAGAVPPLAIGLITFSFNWIGAVIGAVALWPAARLLRPKPVPEV